jgi:hypothetical protein
MRAASALPNVVLPAPEEPITDTRIAQKRTAPARGKRLRST